ncbi:uncharacterized protein LOC113351047 [Papaver somniferum]|uniref:uncharacterized protein LOC113351047 n=1 Tax=Papaver somniferum TaxID=3469 RepID=UPI000E7008D4|nr:uncharacterized protein LOC113351047 [Papaver somniferum]
MKSHIIAEFLAEFPLEEDDGVEEMMDVDEGRPNPKDLLQEIHPRRSKIFVDGSTNSSGEGMGIVFTSIGGVIIVFCFRLEYKATNNEAEYEVVVQALRIAIEIGLDDVRITSDSQLVVRQIEGGYNAVDPVMQKYLQLVKEYFAEIPRIIWRNIGRYNNRHADALAFIASMIEDPKIWHIRIERLIQPSVSREEKELRVMIIEEGDMEVDENDWRAPIYNYLMKGDLPRDRKEANNIKSKATNYEVREGILYRRSYMGLLMRCLSRKEGIEIMKSIHYGDARNHSGTISLAHKTRTQGYFWPYMHKDAKDISTRCEACQRYVKKIHSPCTSLNSVLSVWPFDMWGIDIVGPFVTRTKNRGYLVVETDYFTKWVEAKALQHTIDGYVYDFVLEHIICRFGIPVLIFSDNGNQFEGENVNMLFNTFKIQSGKSTSLYPQSNGQAEATNKTLVSMLKKKLEGHHKGWCEHIPHVLWSYSHTRRDATGMSPFCLTYGMETVFPTEAILPTTRREAWEKRLNSDLILAKLDDLEENRETALHHMKNYHQRLSREYNKRVKARCFVPGDLVLREIPPYQKGSGGKMESTWEGPYIMKRVVGNEAYELAYCEGKNTDAEGKIIYDEIKGKDRKMDHPWNPVYIKKYYP